MCRNKSDGDAAVHQPATQGHHKMTTNKPLSTLSVKLMIINHENSKKSAKFEISSIFLSAAL